MNDFSISIEDAALMIKAIDALRRMNPPKHLDAEFVRFQRRIQARMPNFTEGEVRNLCLGLEAMLRENPMDWKAETLLRRLQSVLLDSAPHT